MKPAAGEDDAIATVMKLSPERRLNLAHDLLVSVRDADVEISSATDPPRLTTDQVAECDRRLNELEADPSKGLSHEEVWRRLRDRNATLG
ncbi:MAG: addiction module protein [Planctomycetota bacterium]